MKQKQIYRAFLFLLLFFLMPCTAKVQAEEDEEERTGTPIGRVVEDGVEWLIYDYELEDNDLDIEISGSKVEIALDADLGDVDIISWDPAAISLNLQGHHVKEISLGSDMILTIGDSVGGAYSDEVYGFERTKITANNIAMGNITAYGEFIMNGGSAKHAEVYDKFTMNGGSIISEQTFESSCAVLCVGRFEMFGGTISSKVRGIEVENGAEILIHDGTVHGDLQGIAVCQNTFKEKWQPFYHLSGEASASVQIDGGKISGRAVSKEDDFTAKKVNGAITLGGVEKVAINGGEFTGEVNLCPDIYPNTTFDTPVTNCVIKNGTFHNAVRIWSLCNVTIENGTFSNGLHIDGDGTVTIRGGKFNPVSELLYYGNDPECALGAKLAGAGKLCVNGGEFNSGLYCDFYNGATGGGVSLAGGTFHKASGMDDVRIYIDNDANPSVNLLSILAPGYTYSGDLDYVDNEKTVLRAGSKIEIIAGEASIPVYYNIYFIQYDGTQLFPPIKRKTGDVYGTLPTPTLSGYTFDGWRIMDEQGNLLQQVTATTKFTGNSDTFLKVCWKKNEETSKPGTGGTTTSGTGGTSKPSTGGTSTPSTGGTSTPSTGSTSKPGTGSTGSTTTSGKPKLSAAKLTLTVGQSSTLKVTGTSKKVSWKTSNKKVATVSSGKVKAKKKGTATITATVDGKKLTCKVTVKAKAPKLNKTSATLKKGKTLSLKVTNATGKVKWKSSNTKVATVSGSGKVKAKKDGTATITATVGGKKLTCKVTVGGKTYKKQDTFLEVGKDLPAGKYRFVPQKEASSYMIMEMRDGFDAEEKSLKKEKTVTLKKGWFVMLSGCYAIQTS